jgi:hypothetical protein
MSGRKKPATRFAVCMQSNDAELHTPRMIYQVLPDETAAKSNYVRVIDNEGEDYLYPAEYFMFLDPAGIERALSRAA